MLLLAGSGRFLVFCFSLVCFGVTKCLGLGLGLGLQRQ